MFSACLSIRARPACCTLWTAACYFLVETKSRTSTRTNPDRTACACLKASVVDRTSNITDNIHQQVERFTQQLQEMIRQSIQNALQSALAELSRVIANLPRDANGQQVMQTIKSESSIVMKFGNGVSKTTISANTLDGEPYVRNIEEREEGNFLYHSEVIYNFRTNSNATFHWKLDLATPEALPEFITDTN